MKALLLVLLQWILLTTGWEAPREKLPDVLFTEDLAAGNPARYYPEREQIAVHIDLPVGTVGTNSLLVHELVHWLQHVQGRLDSKTLCAAEEEAYRLADAYRRSHGVRPVDFDDEEDRPALPC